MEWINTNLDILCWIIIGVAALVAEFLTAATVSIWFTLGAGVALVLAVIGLPVWLQIIAFIVCSAALVASIRKKLAANKQNMLSASPLITDNVTGKIANVSRTIPPYESGQIYIEGVEWTARGLDESQEIPQNTKVIVLKVEGICCYVEKYELE